LEEIIGTKTNSNIEQGTHQAKTMIVEEITKKER
jgi:hypothetical protein